MGDYKGDDYFELLAEQTGNALEVAGYVGPHAFLAAGYSLSGDPEIVLVSNYHTPEGRPYNSGQWHQFNVVRLAGNWGMMTVGSRGPLMSDRERLEQALHEGQPTTVVHVMLEMLRETSRRSEGTVGTAAVVTIMPFGSIPVETNPTFLSWPPESILKTILNLSFAVPDERNPDDGRSYSPAIWSRTGESGYGYRTLITAEPPDTAQHEIFRTGDLADFDLGKDGLASTLRGLPASIFEGFPRHPQPAGESRSVDS